MSGLLTALLNISFFSMLVLSLLIGRGVDQSKRDALAASPSSILDARQPEQFLSPTQRLALGYEEDLLLADGNVEYRSMTMPGGETEKFGQAATLKSNFDRILDLCAQMILPTLQSSVEQGAWAKSLIPLAGTQDQPRSFNLPPIDLFQSPQLDQQRMFQPEPAADHPTMPLLSSSATLRLDAADEPVVALAL